MCIDGVRAYACIDLKSFYASVECVERGLDPFKANLVVADPARGDATICLAITPAMKAQGVKNRCRVFEIPKGLQYVMAKPRMRLYMEKSAEIVSIYLRHVCPDDIHVYSIDECFIDLTPYLRLYSCTPKELVQRLTAEVFRDTGICATAGIGTNLFLAKVALDVLAKHAPDNIGYLDEQTYCRTVAHHRPITDIWNVGQGIARRLERIGIYDMAGVARATESVLYREFGVNAEYLIDHAHGRESCTIADIKSYAPKTTSLTNSQVLFEPYSFADGRIILTEMVEDSTLQLIERHLATDRVSLSIGYEYTGKFGTPSYNLHPVSSASRRLGGVTNSLRRLSDFFLSLYDSITDKDTPIRHLSIGLEDLVDDGYLTVDMFTDTATLERENSLLRAMVDIKSRYGKNAIVKGISFDPKATARARNLMIGGHNAD